MTMDAQNLNKQDLWAWHNTLWISFIQAQSFNYMVIILLHKVTLLFVDSKKTWFFLKICWKNPLFTWWNKQHIEVILDCMDLAYEWTYNSSSWVKFVAHNGKGPERLLFWRCLQMINESQLKIILQNLRFKIVMIRSI
jgi:hypothetical protein